jgi:hypothetical protein
MAVLGRRTRRAVVDRMASARRVFRRDDIVRQEGRKVVLVHQVSDRGSGAGAYFGWMSEAKRENTRCGV